MKLIDTLKKLLFFKLTVIYARYLIGFAFVFASIVKIKSMRFTSIPPTEPVGYFFEAMYQTGFYWNFLGWGQFIAGALLMTQRFATVGAMVFFPIILNVFVITHSINFGMGTPVITTLMLLATIFLIIWDYKKWMILLKHDHQIKLDLRTEPEDTFMTDPLWTITGIIFIVLTIMPWIFNDHSFSMICIVMMLVVGISTLIIKLRKDGLLLRKSKVY
ncbi:hypothetical protein SAMN05660236_3373 [Ohtaekwangia koreensis]|uniref:DoxX protein n=2 Tax=Ohtaekwangia koreensis TaxID=688867 RepID=A0A1T5LKG9_9BACT|nr:hypothetical protein SAMN05660236_3373 [Ohtaekwangia koreensis]